MTTAALAARQITADRRARDLRPSVLRLAADRWAVRSATRNIIYLVHASANGVTCGCESGRLSLPCFHVSAVLAASIITPQPPESAAVAA